VCKRGPIKTWRGCILDMCCSFFGRGGWRKTFLSEGTRSRLRVRWMSNALWTSFGRQSPVGRQDRPGNRIVVSIDAVTSFQGFGKPSLPSQDPKAGFHSTIFPIDLPVYPAANQSRSYVEARGGQYSQAVDFRRRHRSSDAIPTWFDAHPFYRVVDMLTKSSRLPAGCGESASSSCESIA